MEYTDVDQSSDQKARAARGAAEWRRLLGVRLYQIFNAPSRGLLETDRSNNSVSALPRDSSWQSDDAQAVSMSDMRNNVPTEAHEKVNVVRYDGMLENAGVSIVEEALDESQQNNEVPSMREGVCSQESEKQDVLTELREQTRMEQAMIYRADRLRCGGNGVVALQAATAFVVLARRAGFA